METRELVRTLYETTLPVRIIGTGTVSHALIGRELVDGEPTGRESLFLIAEPDNTMSEEFVRHLASERCTCELPKQSGRLLCGRCFSRLTTPIKLALRENSGVELQESYKLALVCLARRAYRERESHES